MQCFGQILAMISLNPCKDFAHSLQGSKWLANHYTSFRFGDKMRSIPYLRKLYNIWGHYNCRFRKNHYLCSMIAVADAGSTKTEWVIGGRHVTHEGINPYHQDEKEIVDILKGTFDEMSDEVPTHIYYYGAGVRETMIPKIRSCLETALSKRTTADKAPLEIDCYSDVVGAARALFSDDAGVACILGTGSNACLYDGNDITSNVPPLGYILGDEGSGAVLGRKFLNALFKGRLNEKIRRAFEDTFHQREDDVISSVYKDGSPARYLASIAPFIHEYRTFDEVRTIIIDNFREFIRFNVLPIYNGERVGAVGGVAFHFEEELRAAAAMEGIRIDVVLQKPIDRLAEYHKAEQA